MRKIYVVTLVMAFLAIGAAAYAATSAEVCVNCPDKFGLGRVPLPAALVQQACNYTPFDFDGEPDEMPYGTTPMTYDPTAAPNYHSFQYGYCQGYNNGIWPRNTAVTVIGDDNTDMLFGDRNQKLLFQICNCPDPNALAAGQNISIRMTILTKGVYWAAPNQVVLEGAMTDGVRAGVVGGVNLAAGTTVVPAVQPAGATNGSFTTVTFASYQNTTQACAANDYISALDLQTKTFGRAIYLGADGITPKTPIGISHIDNAGCTPVPVANQAKILESYKDPATGVWDSYEVSNTDVNNQVSVWWMDVPPMRLDSAEAVVGDKVQIKVQLLNPLTAGICSSCLPICECTFDIATIGCAAAAFTQCVFFPYVVTQVEGWGTGVAVVNTSAAAVTSPTLTFELTDKTGKKCKATQAFTDKVGAWVLDSLVKDLTWDNKPAAGPAALKVTGNFALDGFEFITDGNIGAGNLPRQICP